MIDLATETPIPLTAAARLVPAARNGERTHVSTVLRWILTGARGPQGERVRLDGLRLGGRWVTSHAAIQRFAEALTPKLDAESLPPPRTPTARRRASEQAARELDAAGIR
jgi:hypothetical protein